MTWSSFPLQSWFQATIPGAHAEVEGREPLMKVSHRILSVGHYSTQNCLHGYCCIEISHSLYAFTLTLEKWGSDDPDANYITFVILRYACCRANAKFLPY
jgi:hypothetical protein